MPASKPQTVTCDEGVPSAPYSDCLTLYEQIRAHKSRGILECGTSLSTVVLTQELYDNVAEDGGAPSHVTSMEDDADWHRPSPVDSDKLYNLDLINVSRRSERPVRAVVDNHYLTFHVLQKVFGLDKARYSVSYKPMFVGPLTKHDVRDLKKKTLVPDLRLFGTAGLKLRMILGD
jgi:hypothetical protein